MPPYQMRGRDADRHEGAHRHRGRTSPANGGHHGANAREKPAEEDAGDAEPEVLALHDGQRARREQTAARSVTRTAAGRIGARRDTRRAAPDEIGDPGDEEDGERRGHVPRLREEGAERHGGVARARAGRRSRPRRAVRGRRRRRRGGAARPTSSRDSISGPPASRTAMTAIPSPRPMNPIPSLVLALTLTAPAANAEAPRAAWRHGRRSGARAWAARR